MEAATRPTPTARVPLSLARGHFDALVDMERNLVDGDPGTYAWTERDYATHCIVYLLSKASA